MSSSPSSLLTASRAILSAYPPSFTVNAQHLTWRSLNRIIQLRANVLLLFRTAPKPDLSNVLLTLQLTPSHTPILSRPHIVKVDRYSFRFSNRHTAREFLTAVSHAINSTTAPPSYTVHAPLSSTQKATSSSLVSLSDIDVNTNNINNNDGNKQFFALRTIRKRDAFFSETHLSNTVHQHLALSRATQSRSPFLPRVLRAYETSKTLNYVTDVVAHFGDLRTLLLRLPQRRLSPGVARIIFAQVVLALEDVHRMGVLFRNLTAESVTFTDNGHIKLADFSLAKLTQPQLASRSNENDNLVVVEDEVRGRCRRSSVESDKSDITSSSITSSISCSSCPSSLSLCTAGKSHESACDVDDDAPASLLGRTQSFVGPRLYMSPEHVGASTTTYTPTAPSYGAQADVWALGVLLSYMLTGEHPFGSEVEQDADTLFDAVRSAHYHAPEWLPEPARDVLHGLLRRDEYQRWDLRTVRRSAWMRSIHWEEVRAQAHAAKPVEEVLEVLREAGIESVIDMTRVATTSALSTASSSTSTAAEVDASVEDGSDGSVVSGSEGEDCPFSKGKKRTAAYSVARNLLGFSYLDLSDVSLSA